MVYRFSAVPNKIPVNYFVDYYKLILKFTWKGKEIRIAKQFWGKKTPKTMLPDFKTYYYYNTTVIIIVIIDID